MGLSSDYRTFVCIAWFCGKDLGVGTWHYFSGSSETLGKLLPISEPFPGERDRYKDIRTQIDVKTPAVLVGMEVVSR